MLDPQLLRKDLDAVAARLADRGFTLDTAWFRDQEAQRKAAQTRAEELQSRRNALSRQIGAMKGRGEDTTALMAEVAGIAQGLAQAQQANEAGRPCPTCPSQVCRSAVTRTATGKCGAGASLGCSPRSPGIMWRSAPRSGSTSRPPASSRARALR